MKAEELIPGEWYDFRDGGKRIAAKFTYITKNKYGEYFYFSHYIDNNEGMKAYLGNYSLADCKGLIPMSEIEKYLPYKIEPIYEIY